VTGGEILARALKDFRVEAVFYLMGGPMLGAAQACADQGIRMVDVRHEQAAAMMAHAYARLQRTPGVCMGASGPGTVNLITGIATAWADSAPVIAIGGSSNVHQQNMLGFQETDQVSLFRPITRWADRCYEAVRIPEFVAMAFRQAFGTRPGPVYLDLPGNVLHEEVAEELVRWARPPSRRARPLGDPRAVDEALELLAAAERPVIVSGSGVLWSEAEPALLGFVDRAGVPFWTTPQGRGVIPEDHPLSFLSARSTAFRECDLILELATRQSYVISFGLPRRWNPDAKLIQVDIDATEIGRNRAADVGIVGDVGAVLEQFVAAADGRLDPMRYREWNSYLENLDRIKLAEAEKQMSSGNGRPMHPLRLCKEVRDWLPRDAVLIVDGQEILTFARQSIPFYMPRSLNSGPYGCMGVGLPFGLGAKVALPSAPVVVLHGDGSFGMNAMEMDTALRHNLPVVCVISNNGGWTASETSKLGRDLGFIRYDLMFGSVGCHAAFIEDPEDIRQALDEALQSGKPAVINVITDPQARAQSFGHMSYET